jgi:hypothetical protein
MDAAAPKSQVRVQAIQGAKNVALELMLLYRACSTGTYCTVQESTSPQEKKCQVPISDIRVREREAINGKCRLNAP